jgi:hypothetical protein
MANQLKKLADVQYTPGRPYIPAQAGYCYWQEYQLPNRFVLRTSTSTLSGPNGGTIYVTTSWWDVQPGGTAYRQICVAAVPGQTAIPASTTYTAIVGWNSGGRSIEGLTGDGFFQFRVGPSPIGVVVGLVNQNLSTLPNEPTHAFYAHGTAVDVIESGTVVATAPSAFSATKTMQIARSGTTVTYTYDGWSYTSSVPAYDTQYLDGSLYYTGDSVDDPVIGLAVAGYGEASGTLPRLDGLASNYDYSVDGGYGQSYGTLPALTGSAFINNIITGQAYGTLQPLSGLAADHPYAQAFGTLPALTGEGAGGFPAPAFVHGYGIMPALSGSSVLLVGEIGTAVGTLGAMDGMAANYPMPWGQASGTLPALSGNALLTLPELDKPELNQGLVFSDVFFAPMVARETIREGLQLSGEFDATLLVTDSFMDGLIMQDTYTVSQALQAIIEAGLLLSGASDQSAVPTQYAVNALTGALSTYQGFDFRGFTRAGGWTYAVRADGLYRVRAGDDDGEPITVDIDLGADGFGVPNAKTIEAVYLGLATDGQVYLRANVDGDERSYRVVQRDHVMRALLARGVTGRRWNLALEVVDATEMELDLVEILVAVNQRRWTR